jgi:hypothetical protein
LCLYDVRIGLYVLILDMFCFIFLHWIFVIYLYTL